MLMFVSLYLLLGENTMKKQIKLLVITVFLLAMAASAFAVMAFDLNPHFKSF
jgi:hypothetical protein